MDDCWIQGLLYSQYFLCCVPSRYLAADGLRLPDCWHHGWARRSRELCCSQDRFQRMEDKAAALAENDTPSCAKAEEQIVNYVQHSAERLFYLGEAFGDEAVEQRLIDKADDTYEVCPVALLLALAARVCRLKRHRETDAADVAYHIYEFWNGLVWSQTLAWSNVIDPMLRSSLHAASAYIQLMNAMVSHPQETCHSFATNVAIMLEDAAGLSLTTSKSTGRNLIAYPDVARTALVLGSQGDLLAPERECLTALGLAHAFNARRFLDIRHDLALLHMRRALEVERAALDGFPRLGEGIEFPGVWKTYETLQGGLQVQWRWHLEPDEVPQSLGLSPLSLWDPALTPTFSASVNDAVLEKLLQLLQLRRGRFVEIGTQLGDQCNTRYLRARYNFYGLMIDDNYWNPEINLTTHRVTPDNVVELLQRYATPLDFDVLSLDTDGNQWLLWMQLSRNGFRPKIVVVEYDEEIPYDQDLAIRYSPFPIHQLCLVKAARHPWLFGASLTAMRNLGRSLGYTLVHLSDVDLTFVRRDLLVERDLRFAAQDDPPGLCALARHQAPKLRPSHCTKEWPKTPPPQELLTTATAALAGDFRLQNDWPMERVLNTFCYQ